MNPYSLIVVGLAGIFISIVNNSKKLKSSFVTKGSRKYRVRDLPDKSTAADTLDEINKRLQRLVGVLNKKKQHYSKSQQQIIERVQNYNPNRLIENYDDQAYTSYTLNKGEKIALCLREENGNGKLKDLNTLVYVAVHELAHIGAVTNDHDKDFPRTFKFLLKEAMNNNLYVYENYNENPKSYCDMTINENILDKKL